MASARVASLQTFVLRVSIHCHGCKKKVRKVLRGLEGVHEVKVDAQQHKVTVTGTVDAETLVKRLHKSGKQALPWQHAPAEPPRKHDAKAAPAVEAVAAVPSSQSGDGAKDEAAADKKPEEPVKAPPAESSEKQQAASEKKPEAEKETESEKKAEKEAAKKPGVESKKNGGESEAAESKAKGAEPTKEAAAAKEAGNDEGEAKKMKSKPKDASEASPVAAATDRSLPPAPAAQAPRHAHEAYNPYYAPQPVMSYHMAQPRASVSYYAPQPVPSYSMQQQPPQPAAYSMPPPPQQSPPQEAYSQHHQQQMQQWSPSYLYMPYPHAAPESYYNDYYSPPGTHASPAMPDSSYRLFDDENPNSCSVM